MKNEGNSQYIISPQIRKIKAQNNENILCIISICEFEESLDGMQHTHAMLTIATLQNHLQHTDCGNLNPPNLYISCNSPHCELECTHANACNNLLYACGNLADYNSLNATQTTTCTINCLSANSCTNLTVTSASGHTEFHCSDTDSCVNSAFVCNPSLEIDTHLSTDTTCNLFCALGSCDNIQYLCTGYTSICNARCNDNNACSSLDMMCDQHITSNNNQMSCNLLCDSNSAATCDASSKFSCTESSAAQCTCSGDCDTLRRIGVNTFAPTQSTTASLSLTPSVSSTNLLSSVGSTIAAAVTARSHTFNVVDVEVYAVFTIIWLLLFIFSLYLCWRLYITQDFFRSVRTVVMLVVIFVFEIFYYWIFSFILWANAIAYGVESSIHFYVWSSYLPIMLHISLLFSLCAYYNKYFHRDQFLALFCCYVTQKRQIKKILKQFNVALFVFFMIPMIAVVAAHTDASLPAIIVFISLFGLLGLFMAFAQFVTSLFDLRNIVRYKQDVEQMLIVFVFLAATLFVIIFAVNLAIAWNWNAAKTSQNVEGIRITQLIFELLMLLLMVAMIFYIYYDYIVDNYEHDDDDDDDVETRNAEAHDGYIANDGQLQTSAVDDTNGGYTEEHIYQASADTSSVHALPSSSVRNTSITRRSRTGTNEHVAFSISTMKSNRSKPYIQTPEYDDMDLEEEADDDNDGYNTGDAVDVYYVNDWNRSIVTETTHNRVTVRILDGCRMHDEIDINMNKNADKLRFAQEAATSPVDAVKKKSMHSPPPSLDSVISKHSRAKKAKTRKLPDIPLFGAPLEKQKLIALESEYFSEIPYALVLCRENLFKFNGEKYEGIFANRNNSEENIVSQVDVNGMKKLIENGKIEEYRFETNTKIEERHYAMVFSELIKLWLACLPQPLLQNMPQTFFNDIFSSEDLEMECEKIQEPNLSTLLFIWDICCEINAHQKINKMSIKRLAQIFAPFLYKGQNSEQDAKLKPTIVNFCAIGINWRKELFS